jgi:CBS domain-containing membrane protein
VSPDTAVERIMQREFATVRSDERLDFVDDVMALGRVRHMPVVDDGKLVGVVSQRDLLAASLSRVLSFDAQERRTFLRSIDVREVMAGRPITVSPATSLADAAALMLRHKIGCLPVVGPGGEAVGLVTETDLLRAAYPQERPAGAAS